MSNDKKNEQKELEKQRKAKALRDNLLRRKQALRQRDREIEEKS